MLVGYQPDRGEGHPVSEERRRSPVNLGCAEPHHCPPDVRRRVLAATPMFAGLDEAAIADVDRYCTAVGIRAGEPAYLAGDPADSLLVVATGSLKLARPSLDGREVLVDVVGPGDFLGMLTALGEAAFPDTATALTTSCVLRFSADSFNRVLRVHPSVALTTLEAVGVRLADAHRAVRTLAAGDAEERLAATVLRLARRLGVQRREGLLIDIPLTRADLAAMAGTTTETTSRVLTR